MPKRRSRGRTGGGGGAEAPLELAVHGLAHGGDGLAARPGTQGETVLVRGIFPGETALVAPTGRRGGVSRGRLLRVVEASDDRTEPPCGLADRCGGCPWMGWSLAAQRAQKLAWVREAVLRQAPETDRERIGGALRLVAPDADGLGYRRTARLSWHRTGQGVLMGYRAAGSRRVVDANRCLLLTPDLDRAWTALRARLAEHLQGSGELVLASTPSGVVAELRAAEDQPGALYDALRALAEADDDSPLRGARLRMEATVATFGEVDTSCLSADGSTLQMGEVGFQQANAGVNAELVREVVALAQPEGARLLELYAGHGNFTVALAPGAEALTAVEMDASAAEAGRRNLAERGLGQAKLVAGDVAERAAGPRVDVVVLDPPRTGAREVLPAIIARRPQRIVYVSCDLPTLRRDLAVLAEAGFAVDAATAFDMFPHTAHVETVVRLVPSGA